MTWPPKFRIHLPHRWILDPHNYVLGDPIHAPRWVIENRHGHHIVCLRIHRRAYVIRLWKAKEGADR